MAFTVSSLELSHTQILRQHLANEIPSYAESHDNRLWLAVGSYIQVSQYGKLSDWQYSSKEYLRGSGQQVTGLRTFGDALAVFTRSSIFLITGNSKRSWGVTKIEDERGTERPETIRVSRSMLWYQTPAGGCYVKQGTPDLPARCVSMEVDLGVPTHSVLYGRGSEGVSVHLHNGPELYRTDPDSYQVDPKTGEASVAWFKVLLPHDMRHVWVLRDQLYGIRATGEIYRIDVESLPSDTGKPMRVTIAMTGGIEQEIELHRLQVTTADVDGTVKVRTPVGEKSAEVAPRYRLRSGDEPHRRIRQYETAVHPEDPGTAVVTYESGEVGATLLGVRFTTRRNN